MVIRKQSLPGGPPEGKEHVDESKSTQTAKGVRQAIAVRPDEPRLALPSFLPAEQYELILSQRSRPYVVVHNGGNPFAIPLHSRQFKNVAWAAAKESNTSLKRWELDELIEQLTAQVEIVGRVTNIWSRVAPLRCGGFEIDLGDSTHTRVRVTAGQVDILPSGSDVVFYRLATMLPLPVPAEEGDLDLLRNKVNLPDTEYWLLIAWIIYTLAHAKMPSSKYVILVVHGDQGSGKTMLCSQVVLGLLDPSQLGAQVFPHNAKDLAIMMEHAHVVVFDNMRAFRAAMSDVLCMTSTGGTLSSRALYTNAELHTLHVHGAVVLNGIHHLLTQADFSERCLTVHMPSMPPDQRKSEADLIRELERDKPAIFRGLLDLTAKILAELPNAVVEHPPRMIEFVRWLAAMERVLGYAQPVLQLQYAASLEEAQRDSLLDTLLGTTILEFGSELEEQWSGTPSQLLSALNNRFSFSPPSSRDWPSNPIALSKRLNALKASLRTQGIVVEIRRGKERTIIVRKEVGA
jgi:hypothetical protein